MTTTFAMVAFAASVVLFAKMHDRLLPFVALVVSGLEVAMSLGWVSLSVAKVPLALVFAVALALTGGLLWIRTASKTNASAATLVTVVGVIQALWALKIL